MLNRSILLCAAALISAAARATPPETPKHPVTDTFDGAKVVDDYRWLEDWNDPKVKAWSEAQNAYARSVLDALPSANAIRARVTELRKADSPDYLGLASRGGKLFALKRQPPKQQPMLVVMESADHPETARVVVDPNTIDTKGTTAIDFFVPSLDGALVAVSMSEGGSESGTVYVYDVKTGSKREGETVPRVNGGTAGGSVAWAGDNSGFFYTRYPRGTERPPEDMDFFQQVYFHSLGTPTEKDRYEVGKDFPRIAEIALAASDDGKRVLASVNNGDGGEVGFWARSPEGKWGRVAGFTDKIVKAKFGAPGTLDALSRRTSPKGEVVRIDLAAPSLEKAASEVPAGTLVVEDFVRVGERLLVQEQDGGQSRLHVYGNTGKPEEVTILPVSSITDLEKAGDEVLIRNESFIAPPRWVRWTASGVEPTALARTSPADFSDCEVVREQARSKDGTMVPITIVRPKNLPKGPVPTLLYGYGGYGVNTMPTFSEARKVWLEQGCVWAFANIRGGGEFGEQWHLQGNLTHKQNVFDDFAACMKRLVELGITSTDKLAIIGGSNGGLLMGAMITQHPQDCRAVVSSVGIYDMLRVELSPNGAFNVTEFGTVKDPEQFKAMFAYSPYHHVVDGTVYPAVLFMTGANDPRVDPMQSRKMTARLQAATAGTAGLGEPPHDARPVLLRTSASSGHGIGSSLSELIEQDVDRFAFLFRELGVEYREVKAGARAGAAGTD